MEKGLRSLQPRGLCVEVLYEEGIQASGTPGNEVTFLKTDSSRTEPLQTRHPHASDSPVASLL